MVNPSIRWVKFDNLPVGMAQGMAEDNMHISGQFLKAVLNGHALADASMLAFRDPATFVVANIHSRISAWENISRAAPYELIPNVLHQQHYPLWMEILSLYLPLHWASGISLFSFSPYTLLLVHR